MEYLHNFSIEYILRSAEEIGVADREIQLLSDVVGSRLVSVGTNVTSALIETDSNTIGLYLNDMTVPGREDLDEWVVARFSDFEDGNLSMSEFAEDLSMRVVEIDRKIAGVALVKQRVSIVSSLLDDDRPALWVRPGPGKSDSSYPGTIQDFMVTLGVVFDLAGLCCIVQSSGTGYSIEIGVFDQYEPLINEPGLFLDPI